LPAIPRS